MAAVFGCGTGSTPTVPSGGDVSPAPRVLVLTATAGFRHDSIPAAISAIRSMGSTSGFSPTFSEDVSVLTEANLDRSDVVMFVLTSGELPLTDSAKAALLAFVSSGGGFIGVHSATDTLYQWPEYERLVGAYFREHPWTQRADVLIEDSTHPATTGLPSRLSLVEEFYTFRENPRPRVQVLLRLDAASVGAAGDFPLAWAHSFGTGRAYYNALGHFADTWNDAKFRQQIAGAIRWAAAGS